MRRKKKKKFNKKKLFLSISILVILPFASIKLSKIAIEAYSLGTNSTSSTSPITISENDAKYGIIKEDINEKYLGKRTRKSKRSRWIFYNF